MGRRKHARSRFRALLHEVEFVKGHDGFLRGKPEPELIFATYAQDDENISLLQTSRRTLEIQGGFPCVTSLPNRLVINARVPRWARQIALLCLAVENDGGTDASTLTAALAEPSAWKTRARDSSIAAPFALDELSVLRPTPAPTAMQVRLTFAGEEMAQVCKVDDWIAAALILLDARRAAGDTWIMRLLSDDRKNDWKAKMELRL